MLEWLKALFRREKTQVPAARERTPDDEFAVKHQTFHLFLTAWNSFQDTLSTIEYTLCCVRPFGMCQVRALATSVVTRSFQCIQLLDRLAPGRKAVLREKFTHLQEVISPLLEDDGACLIGPSVIPLDDGALDEGQWRLLPQLADRAVSGLLHVREVLGEEYPGLIPPCFVVTAAGTQRILRTRGLQEELSGYVQKAGGITPRSIYKISAQLRRMIHEGLMPVAVAQDFLAQVRRLRVAMQGEPGHLLLRGRVWQEGDSETDHGLVVWGPEVDLYAPDDELLNALRHTISLKYGAQCLMYRRYRGLTDSSAAFCVLCMAVPHARVSGLAHTMNPMRATQAIVHVYAWRGLPAAVEQDRVPVDEFHVLRRKPHAVRLSTPADIGNPVIGDDVATRIAALALAVEEKAGGIPQSMHWILRPDGQVCIIMARPMVLGELLDPEAVPREDVPAPLLNWGITASAGVVSGPVKIVRSEQDAKNFPDGGILVVAQDSYAWLSLLDRAAGVITEKGFLGSRLASVCREFGKPALFNVPDCLEKLADAGTVTLCADMGMVYPGAVPPLLELARPPRDFLPHSPVYQALQTIAAKAAPLTIMPDTPEFKAANCQTFHDIARYSHEKAVSAMFELGSARQHAPQRVKQLFDGTLKQFWVIDLENAFEAAAASDPTIDVSRIQCPPFHALWYGMNVHPWQGPPPVDNKGFMSILYEATANPHLDPATQSAYFSEKNYFLLSREYCSLYSRFGFHFVSTEGRLGPHKSNNALVFQLRGGAANVERRIMRVRFVADILWECGLEPVLLHDSVRARVANIDVDNGLAVLSVLGYLTIHTRQLDMIMADKRQVLARKEAMLRDCKELLLTTPSHEQL